MAGTLQDTLAASGFSMPKVNFAQYGNWIVYFLAGLLLAGLLAIAIFFVIDYMKYNKTFILFKRVNGRPTKVFVDKAIFERIGIAGDYWARWRKLKKIIPRPKIEVAKNEYWFWEREDGELINFGIQDIDEMMKMAKVHYVDEDMRLQRLGIQKNLKDRLDKMSFWTKYGERIMSVVFLIIVTICLIVLFTRIENLVKVLPELADSLTKVANAISDVATRQGSGLTPAP